MQAPLGTLIHRVDIVNSEVIRLVSWYIRRFGVTADFNLPKPLSITSRINP
jgi:hypothetical protein